MPRHGRVWSMNAGFITLSILVALVIGASSVVSGEERDDWRNCSPTPLRSALCSSNAQELDYDAVRLARDSLRAQWYDRYQLCRIESELSELEHQCAFSGRGAASLIVDVMRTLAENWKQQGQLTRADQIFQRAYDLETRRGFSVLMKIGILQGWSDLKIKMGRSTEANDLAELQTAFARAEFEKEHTLKYLFLDSLRFHIQILERLGDLSRAKSLRDEARSIEEFPLPPCTETCGQPFRPR